MKKLYKVLFTHTAPKSQKQGIKSYVIADDDEHVYRIIDKEYAYTMWSDADDDGESFDIYDEDYNVIGSESFKERMMRIKGQMNDEDYDYSDAYYGITLYGWEFVKEVSESDIDLLSELSIIATFEVQP